LSRLPPANSATLCTREDMPSSRQCASISQAFAASPREDFALLAPHLQAVELPVRKPIEARKKLISQVYFIESGFASVVANGTSKPTNLSHRC
jgi:hypothetical protein